MERLVGSHGHFGTSYMYAFGLMFARIVARNMLSFNLPQSNLLPINMLLTFKKKPENASCFLFV